MSKLINTYINNYLLTIRIKGQSIRTAIPADSAIHAKLIAEWNFGIDSVLSTPVKITEAEINKPLTPDQSRIKSMQDRVKRDQEAVKAEPATQKIKAGQKALISIRV